MSSPRRAVLALAALATLFSVNSGAWAVPFAEDHDHSHEVNRGLPGVWYHESEQPAHALFRRGPQAPTDGATYPTVGSDAWRAAYPAGPAPLDINELPPAWVQALNAAVSAGKIPDIPQSVVPTPPGNPVYPPNVKMDSPEVCAWTNRVCNSPDDLWNGPTGVAGVSFDDGPLPESGPLYDFLQSQNQKATHFFIGRNVLANPDMFMRAFGLNHDIAVHTWTHPYMTSQSNLQVLAELGWTMQIIHDSTGGRLPKYWRPPTGDVDNRVRAIAKEIFGLTAILWNQDTSDWTMTTPGGTTPEKYNANMQQWLTGPKTPGLVILQHELSNLSVKAFIDTYPMLKTNGWKAVSVAEIAAGGAGYRNSGGNDQPVTSMNILVAAGGSAPTPATGSPTTSPSAGGPVAAVTGTPKPASTSPAPASGAKANGAFVNARTPISSAVCLVGVAVLTALL